MEERKFTLKELRARKNETQKETADALGISPQTYNSWENNFAIVKIGNAKNVAIHFGVNLDDIFFRT